VPRALETVAGILAGDPTLTLAGLLENADLFTEQVVENLVSEHYHQGSEDQRRVLEALAVYDKPVPAAAVSYVLLPFYPDIDAEECLRVLARHHFVTHHRGRGTYELHPLDRQYAYARIPDGGTGYNRRALHRRAAGFYAALNKPPGEWKTITDLQPQLEGFEQLFKAGEYDEAFLIIERMDFLYLAVWGYSELVIGLRRRLTAVPLSTRLANQNWYMLGLAYNRLWLAEEAIHCFRTVLEALEAAGLGGAVGDVKGNLGRSLLLVGRIEEAVGLFDETIRLMGLGGSLLDEGLWTGRLGEAFQRLGKTEAALACHLRALETSRALGDTRWRVTHLSNLAEIYRHMGDLERAAARLQLGLQLAEVKANRQGQAFCLMRLAQVHHDAGRPDQARGHYERGLQIGLPPCNVVCATQLGVLCLETGRAAEARGYFEQGMSLCRGLLDKTPRLYDALYLLALGQLSSGRPEEALASYRQALEVCSAPGVVGDALQDVRRLQGLRPPPEGLGRAVRLLEQAVGR
jgi:tetratricopeptide (TPR) repeat protein